MRQAYPGTVKSRLVGREMEVKVVCNQPGLWNSGGGGGHIGYSLIRHAGQSAFRLVLLGTSCCYSSMPISQPSSSCHRESVTPENWRPSVIGGQPPTHHNRGLRGPCRVQSPGGPVATSAGIQVFRLVQHPFQCPYCIFVVVGDWNCCKASLHTREGRGVTLGEARGLLLRGVDTKRFSRKKKKKKKGFPNVNILESLRYGNITRIVILMQSRFRIFSSPQVSHLLFLKARHTPTPSPHTSTTIFLIHDNHFYLCFIFL